MVINERAAIAAGNAGYHGNMRNNEDERKKKWLGRGKALEGEIKRLEAIREEKFNNLTSGTTNYERTPVSGSADPHRIDAYSIFCERIDRKKMEWAEILEETLNAVEKIENSKMREILIGRYIEGKFWDEIAQEIGYTTRHVMRLHRAALNNLRIPESKKIKSSHDVITTKCH